MSHSSWWQFLEYVCDVFGNDRWRRLRLFSCEFSWFKYQVNKRAMSILISKKSFERARERQILFTNVLSAFFLLLVWSHDTWQLKFFFFDKKNRNLEDLKMIRLMFISSAWISTFFFPSVLGSVIYSWVTFTRKPSSSLSLSTHNNTSTTNSGDNRKSTHDIV